MRPIWPPPSGPGREDTDLIIPLSASPSDVDGSETISGVYIVTEFPGYEVVTNSGQVLEWDDNLLCYVGNLAGDHRLPCV